MMIPGQLGLIGFVMEMHMLGWVNTHLPLIIPSLINAFGVFWMTQYIRSSVPNELLESARIDGCNDFRTFIQIVLPVIKPATITLCLLFFLWSWNNYLLPLVILNDQNLYTVPLGISLLTTLYRIDYGAEILALTIAVLPVVLMFILGSKYIVEGLTAGAVKG